MTWKWFSPCKLSDRNCNSGRSYCSGCLLPSISQQKLKIHHHHRLSSTLPFLSSQQKQNCVLAPESINVLASQFPHLTVTINRSWRRWPLSSLHNSLSHSYLRQWSCSTSHWRFSFGSSAGGGFLLRLYKIKNRWNGCRSFDKWTIDCAVAQLSTPETPSFSHQALSFLCWKPCIPPFQLDEAFH